MGIEPTYPAWKAGVLPLNYTRKINILCDVKYRNPIHMDSGILYKMRKKRLELSQDKLPLEPESSASAIPPSPLTKNILS